MVRVGDEVALSPDVTVAALYVDGSGVYANLPGVEVWDEARDARLYEGPWPVVAHPPCKAWSIMGQCRPEIERGDDGGTFWAALQAVEQYGGVLEHPALSLAWKVYGLPKPPGIGWQKSWLKPGWSCVVDQAHYGHRANKWTWLYFVGDDPPELRWGHGPVRSVRVAQDGGGGRDQRSRTPPAFRDVLLQMARTAAKVPA